eukprot:gene10128-13624_t
MIWKKQDMLRIQRPNKQRQTQILTDPFVDRPIIKNGHENSCYDHYTGFLGSGKTTLVNHILTDRNHGMRLAIIENEFGEVGVDDKLIKSNRVFNSDEDIVEMLNGCICCTVRTDLIETIKNIFINKKIKVDGVLIETAGLADPAPVAQTFFVDEEVRDNYRVYDTTTNKYETVNSLTYKNTANFYIFNDYESNDNGLKLFARHFRDWTDEINTSIKFDYSKCKDHASAMRQICVYNCPRLEEFEDIDAIELYWIERCNNGGLQI